MSGVFRFADFELHVTQRQLLRQGQPLPAGGRSLDLLILLLAQRHRVVSKLELIDHCWPGQAVEPNNLAVQIWALRRLLGPAAITTVPGRGYQFTATVQCLPAAPGEGETPALAANAANRQTRPPSPDQPLVFGREADLALLRTLLRQHRLVTLLGPMGVGKTCLAQALAGAWQELPAVLVDLAPVHHDDGVATAVRAALGLADSAPSPPPATDHLAWLGLLSKQPLLLVLDNCEHQAAAVARLASALLAQAPALRLLVTSLQPLGLPAEQQLRLQPLPVHLVQPVAADAGSAHADHRTAPLPANPALQLLLARIQALEPGFQLTPADLPLALQLCRRLDGLPLAIELAAARVPALGLAGVLARLDDRLRLLHRDGPPGRPLHVGVAAVGADNLHALERVEGGLGEARLRAAIEVQRVDPGEARKGGVGELRALIDAQSSDPAEVLERPVGDAGLVALHEEQRLDAREVRKGRVGDLFLLQARHVQLLDAAQVGEGPVGDARVAACAQVQHLDADEVPEGVVRNRFAVAARHIEVDQPAKVRKVGVVERALDAPRHVRRAREREAPAPAPHAAVDARRREPGRRRHGVARLDARQAERAGVPLVQEAEDAAARRVGAREDGEQRRRAVVAMSRKGQRRR